MRKRGVRGQATGSPSIESLQGCDVNNVLDQRLNLLVEVSQRQDYGNMWIHEVPHFDISTLHIQFIGGVRALGVRIDGNAEHHESGRPCEFKERRRGWFSAGVGSQLCLLYTSDAADEEDSVDLGG